MRKKALSILKDDNEVLNSIIRECRDGRVKTPTLQEIERFNLKAGHLEFENQVLNVIWDKIKEILNKGIKGLENVIKKWLSKAFDAINTIIDSLILAFPKLHIVKESKDLLKKLIVDDSAIEDDDSAT
jgi:hypothetical protein